MKALKILGKVLLWIVGIVAVLAVALPLWISPVARVAANIAVPKVTGSPFHLDRFNLSADWFSLATDTIVVKDITVGGLYYEQDMSMVADWVTGKGKGTEAKQQAPKVESPAKSSEPKRAKKIIIDHLLLEDVVLSVNGLKLPAMRLELSGIGRKSNGVTMEEAWTQISEQVVEKSNALGKNLNELTKKVDAKKIGEAVEAIKAIDAGGTVEKTGEQVDKVVDALKGLLK